MRQSSQGQGLPYSARQVIRSCLMTRLVAPTSRSRLAGVTLLAPTWLVLGVFFLLPLAVILVISFGRADAAGGYEPIGSLWQYLRSGEFLANYRRSLQSDYLLIFWRSTWMAVLTTVLCLGISYPVAYYIAVAAPPRLKTVLLLGVVLPFWTSFLIRIYAWQIILRDEGLVNTGLASLHLLRAPLRMLDT